MKLIVVYDMVVFHGFPQRDSHVGCFMSVKESREYHVRGLCASGRIALMFVLQRHIQVAAHGNHRSEGLILKTQDFGRALNIFSRVFVRTEKLSLTNPSRILFPVPFTVLR